MAGKIELVAPLDGVLTIEPEDTASNFTVTIPAVTSTLVNEDSDIEAQVKTATNATGDAPIYACRAWCNFDGAGTPSIRASGNVSSVVRNSTGTYTVNFTTAMPDANYNVVGGGYTTTATNSRGLGNFTSITTSSFQYVNVFVSTTGGLGTAVDGALMYFSIFR